MQIYKKENLNFKVNYWGIIAIAFLSFSSGTSWYIPGGIFSELQKSFVSDNVNPSNVDLSLSIYTIGLMVGAPLIAIIFYKMNRKNILLLATLDFIISNILIAFSVNWPELLFFRFMCGIANGALVSIGTLVATSMVPKDKKSLAIAIIYSATYAATFTLIPIFTWWSNIGINNTLMVEQFWRWSFFITGIIAFFAFILIFIFVPKNLKISNQRNLKFEVKSLLYWPYMLSMLFTMSVIFCIFMIYPLLQEQWKAPVYGIIYNSQDLLAILLLLYGLFSFIGNQIGGFFADKRTFPTIYYVLFGLILDIIGLFYLVFIKIQLEY